MNKFVTATRKFLADERGTEIVEWAIVGGLVVAVGAAIFVAIGTDASRGLSRLEAATDQIT